jgi:hypothetical protein
VKKRGVRVRILKPYETKCVDFAPGEIVWVSQQLADELILADAAEYPEEQFDLAIERGFAENPQAIANLNAYIDAEIKTGRCEPMETLFEEQR